MSKTVLAEVKGWTPVIDLVMQDVGLVTAAVFGRVWRYCQMENMVCYASMDTLADELNISVPTIRKHIEQLVEAGYLVDKTPNLNGHPHTFADTGKAGLSIQISAGGKETLQPKKRDSAIKKIDSQLERNLSAGCKESLQKDSIREDKERILAAENSLPLESESSIPETPVIYPEKEEEFTSTGLLGILHSGEKVINPGAARALAKGQEKFNLDGIDLSWLENENVKILMETFVTASGIKPVKGDYGLWRKAAGNWLLIKLTTSDIVQAVQKLRAGNLTISGPQSVTNTARAIHCNPTGEQQGTLDSLERAGFTYGGS